MYLSFTRPGSTQEFFKRIQTHRDCLRSVVVHGVGGREPQDDGADLERRMSEFDIYLMSVTSGHRVCGPMAAATNQQDRVFQTMLMYNLEFTVIRVSKQGTHKKEH